MAWQRILTTCSTHLQRPLTSPCRLAIIRSNGSTGVVPAGKAVAAALPPLTGCCSLVTPFSSCSSRRMDSMHPGPSRPLATREQQEAVAPAAAAASAAAAAAAAGGSGVVAGGGQSPPLPPPPPPPPRPLRLDGIAGLPQFLKPDCLLFYSREMEPLARRAAELSGGKVTSLVDNEVSSRQSRAARGASTCALERRAVGGQHGRKGQQRGQRVKK